MRVKFLLFLSICINLSLLILFLFWDRMNMASVFEYQADYTLIQKDFPFTDFNNLINVISSLIFIILLIKPEKRVINRMRNWNFYLLLIFSSHFMLIVSQFHVASAAILWGQYIYGYPNISVFNNNLFTLYLAILGIYILQIVVLHILSLNFEENKKKEHITFLTSLADKLIIIFLVSAPLSYGVFQLFLINDINFYKWLYLPINEILLILLFSVGILGIRLKFDEDKMKVERKIFVLINIIFYLILGFLTYNIIFSNADEYRQSSQQDSIALTVGIAVIIFIGILTDTLLIYFKKIINPRVLSRIQFSLISYISVVIIIGLLLLHPIILNDNITNEEPSSGFIILNTISINNNQLSADLYHNSNNILWSQIDIDFNLTFSSVILFSKSVNGFKLEQVINITAVQTNVDITGTGDNYTLKINFKKIYHLELTLNQSIDSYEYIALGNKWPRGYYEQRDYMVVATFPEMLEL